MERFGVEVGQAVYDADGKRLGKVTRCNPWGFEVRRGLFSPRSWVVRYAEIAELGPDSVKIARSDADLFELAAGELPHSWAAVARPGGGVQLPAAPDERQGSDALARSAHRAPDRE